MIATSIRKQKERKISPNGIEINNKKNNLKRKFLIRPSFKSRNIPLGENTKTIKKEKSILIMFFHHFKLKNIIGFGENGL